ncbi:MAG TPA: DUF4190 domain-containing protein [Mycobacterium sp.]|nr:DUF4190 domain-containing protein [Mycobacterium sp.]
MSEPPSYGPYPGSGPYPGGGYPAPPPQPYSGWTPLPPTRPRNGLGTWSLIVAIVAVVLVWTVIGGVILGIVAAVLGFIGYGHVKRGQANNGGVAIAGIVLGIMAIVGGLAFIVIWVAVFNQVGGSTYVDCLKNAGQDQAKIQQCADQFKKHIQNQFSVTLTPTP